MSEVSANGRAMRVDTVLRATGATLSRGSRATYFFRPPPTHTTKVRVPTLTTKYSVVAS